MLRLSIIVPFYNVEKYIDESIRSLYDQDIPQEEYEVICVDDCSPDGSRAIVERLQKEYKTLRLVCHDRNKKLGGARNTGLREAKGEYVWFVDSDDTIYPNVLKTILDTAEKTKVDMLQFDYTRGEQHIKNIGQKEGSYDGERYLFLDAAGKWHTKLSGAWRQVFRREYLQKNELAFIEDAMYEDTDYLLQAFLKAEKVRYIPIIAYDYRINSESVTEAPKSPERLAWRINLIARCRRCVDMVKTQEAKDVINQMVTKTLTNLRSVLKGKTYKQRRRYVQCLDPAIRECKDLVNWRTWMAVRYGITIFV